MDHLVSALDFLDGHWLLVSFMAPLLWALVNIIDVYFVKGIYQDELDGTIITGLFQIIPAIVALFFINSGFAINGVSHIEWYDPILLLALFGGFLFNLAFYYYFKALFRHSDAAFLQIIWSLTIIVVPVLSFIIFKEVLSWVQYLGMGIALIGALALSSSKKLKEKFSWRYLLIMSAAVVILSVSMICEDKVYGDLTSRGYGFSIGFLFFSLGAVLNGLFFAIIKKRNPFPFIRKYFHIFIISEIINVLGNFASQKAIAIAPSVSFVAVVETFVPVFIVAISLLVLAYLAWKKKKSDVVKSMYEEQLDGVWVKVFATIIMSLGVYIISS